MASSVPEVHFPSLGENSGAGTAVRERERLNRAGRAAKLVGEGLPDRAALWCHADRGEAHPGLAETAS